MGIYDAMNASVTGMTAQANYLSNTSQNMANSNTVGYKEADTQFATLVDQAAVGQTSAGGVMVETRNAIAQQGTLQSTSSSTDLAINGNGFFVVSDTSGASYLTRAGSFVTDANGNLVNSAGFKLMGYPIASNGVTGMTVNSLANMQVININSSSLQATPSTSGTFTANLPAADAVVAAANLPSANLATSTYSEKTSIVAYDDLGTAHTLDVYLSNTGPDASGNPTWSASVYDHAADNATSGNFPYSSAALTNQTLRVQPHHRPAHLRQPAHVHRARRCLAVAQYGIDNAIGRLVLGHQRQRQRQRRLRRAIGEHRQGRNGLVPARQWIERRRL